jgi:hypothetical protein
MIRFGGLNVPKNDTTSQTIKVNFSLHYFVGLFCKKPLYIGEGTLCKKEY